MDSQQQQQQQQLNQIVEMFTKAADPAVARDGAKQILAQADAIANQVVGTVEVASDALGDLVAPSATKEDKRMYGALVGVGIASLIAGLFIGVAITANDSSNKKK